MLSFMSFSEKVEIKYNLERLGKLVYYLYCLSHTTDMMTTLLLKWVDKYRVILK